MRLPHDQKIQDRDARSGVEACGRLDISDRQNRDEPLWPPFVIGVLVFWFVTGGTVLRPGNIGWLMNWDRATYLLGWMFFRNAPILQQPLGANWAYGMEMSSSIVYPDGVPLMALLLKPFKALLPEHFQYFGIWILICYLLQSFFAWKLLGRIRLGIWQRVFGTLFFVLAPPFVGRLSGHFAVGSHWLLLASLYLYFSPRLRSKSWILLLIVASLINPYLLVMTILFFGAALVRHFSNGELTIVQGLKTVALTVVLLLFFMWEAGYFMSSTVGTGGFGIYRSNILTFINPRVADNAPNPSWSHLLKDQRTGPGDYEGSGFLGTGAFLLSIVAVAEMLRSGPGSINWRKLWPLLLVFCVSLLYALSNNVAIGPRVIFHYELPQVLDRLTDALRASGRFIWPAYYILMTAILAVVFRGLGPRPALAVIAFCASLQLADSWEALTWIRNGYQVKFKNAGIHPIELSSSFWRKAAEKYARIECVLPQNVPEPHDEPENYLPVCLYAATHRLPINMAYLGRVDTKKLEAEETNLLRIVESGQLDPTSLYVFQNAGLWATAALGTSASDWVGVVDGFKVIAPGWDGEENQDRLAALRDLFLDNHFLEYRFGSQLSFKAGAEGPQFLGAGWSQPEPGGVWSDAGNASIVLLLDREPPSGVALHLDATGFVTTKCPQQQIEVSVNGTRIGELTYTLENPDGPRSLRVPREVLVARHGLVRVQFAFKNNVSPVSLGLSSDPRSVALALRTLALEAADSN